MPRNTGPEKDAGALIPTEVVAVHRLPGITFRPGIVYQTSAAIRESLDRAGVLKKTSTSRD